MAFKIVYGAGQTLSSASEGKFGSGYGFLEMHREPDVKAFAFEVLEKRLMGNSYRFERGSEWPEDEAIVISSFQRCGNWYVLSRLRPISESRNRAYFLAEFLLISEPEARELAGLEIVPAKILASQNEEIWFQGERWNRSGAWLDTAIDLRALVSGNLRAAGYCYPAFTHSECLLEHDRKTEWKPSDVLLVMEATQLDFASAYADRIKLPYRGVEPLFELAWNTISLTSFYLDPRSGIDLQLEPKSEGLPYTWTGVFRRVQYHEELLQGPYDKVTETNRLGTEEEFLASGWIVPTQVEEQDVAPVMRESQPLGVPLPNYSRGGSAGKTKKAGEKRFTLPVWAMPVLGVLVIVALAVWGWSLYSAEQKAITAHDWLENLIGENKIARIYRAIEDEEYQDEKENYLPIPLGHEKFAKYIRFHEEFKKLRVYLENPQGGSVSATREGEAPRLPESGSAFMPFAPAHTLWAFATENHQFLNGRTTGYKDTTLTQLEKIVGVWESSLKAADSAASTCGIQTEWETYKLAVFELIRSDLEGLITGEEDRRKESKTVSSAEIEYRERLGTVVSIFEEALGTTKGDSNPMRQSVAALVPSAKALSTRTTAPDPNLIADATGPDKDADKGSEAMAKDEAKDQPKSDEKEPSRDGLIVSAKFVLEDPDAPGYFPFPKEGYNKVYLAKEDMLRKAIRASTWQKSGLRMPLPQLETTDGLVVVTATRSSVTAAKKMGDVHTGNESLFSFLPDQNEPLVAFVAEKEGGECECWIYLRSLVGESLNMNDFWKAEDDPAGSVQDLGQIRIALVATGAELGDVVVEFTGESALVKDQATLGMTLVTKSQKIGATKKELEELQGLIEPAEAFNRWFPSGKEVVKSPASTFFSGVKAWTEDERAATIKISDVLPPIGKFENKTSWDLLSDPSVNKKAIDAATARKDLSPAGASVDIRIASFLVEMCSQANEPPIGSSALKEISFYLPMNDPLHTLGGITTADTSLASLISPLANLTVDYNLREPTRPTGTPKTDTAPAIPASPKELFEYEKVKAKYDNGLAMKKNWEGWSADLEEILKFAGWCDTNESSYSSWDSRIQSAFDKVGKYGDRQGILEAYLEDLNRGNLEVEDIKFEIQLLPRGQ